MINQYFTLIYYVKLLYFSLNLSYSISGSLSSILLMSSCPSLVVTKSLLSTNFPPQTNNFGNKYLILSGKNLYFESKINPKY